MYQLYAQLGKLSYKLSFPVTSLWLRLKRSRRVRVMVFNKKGQLLLVRNWFGPQHWSLPGGGCKYLETEQAAAVRELHEETGIKVTAKQLSFVYEYKHPTLGYRAPVYVVRLKTTPKAAPAKKITKLEIIEQVWFNPTQLPPRSQRIKEALRQLRQLAK